MNNVQNKNFCSFVTSSDLRCLRMNVGAEAINYLCQKTTCSLISFCADPKDFSFFVLYSMKLKNVSFFAVISMNFVIMLNVCCMALL